MECGQLSLGMIVWDFACVIGVQILCDLSAWHAVQHASRQTKSLGYFPFPNKSGESFALKDCVSDVVPAY